MIKRISKIKNLGRFEDFSGSYDFSSNTIIFGFNGAGKSTLSDIFYSLSMDGADSYITKRRTLNREGEVGEKPIEIEIASEDGSKYEFGGDSWNGRPNSLFVFNENYVEEHVFVSKQIEGDTVPIGIGIEGSRLLRQRDNLIQSNVDILAAINSDIALLGGKNLKIKDFTQSKITIKTPLKKLEKIASFALFPIGGETTIQEKIKRNEAYNYETEVCDKCEERYESIRNIEPISIANTYKKIKKIPRVSSKELSKFLEDTLTTADISWAVRGYKNQKNRSVCPMCGQEICDKAAINFFNKLGKYVSQGRNEQVATFSKELSAIAMRLDGINITERIAIFVQIVNELNTAKLLLKKDTNRLQKGLSWAENNSQCIGSLAAKIHYKAENPYIDIEITDEEDESLRLLNSVISNIIIMGDILDGIRNRIEEKNNKNFIREEAGKIFELSYGDGGGNRVIAERIKSNAASYCKNIEKLERLKIEITDCYNQSRLNAVNDFLLKLNTRIKIEVKNNLYYIKLKDFQAKELDKKNTIFSEGENRAIAFAYYLAEISYAENGDAKRTIVIDDPISSMDLSRKSMISHKIAEMMNNEDLQIILMSHDISFVERVVSYLDSSTTCDLMEIRSNKEDFLPLNIADYLTDDRMVYEHFIESAVNSNREIDKVIGLMSLRPYSFVLKVSDEAYSKIEKASTYFAHTLYSKSGRIAFKASDYCNRKLRSYVRLVNKSAGCRFNPDCLAGDYSFDGFDFNSISSLYNSISLDSMDNMRKKVMLMRPLIEACFFQLSSRSKFDPEHIGSMYSKTIKANKNDPLKYKMCIELKELYDASKKYHHGADEGSLLGISWVNPNEIEYFDARLQEIVEIIKDNGMIRELSA